MLLLKSTLSRTGVSHLPVFAAAREGVAANVGKITTDTPNDLLITQSKGMSIQDALKLAQETEWIIWNKHLIQIFARKCKTLAEMQNIPNINTIKSKEILISAVRILVLTDETHDTEKKLELLDKLLQALQEYGPKKPEIFQQFKPLARWRNIPKPIKRKIHTFIQAF